MGGSLPRNNKVRKFYVVLLLMERHVTIQLTLKITEIWIFNYSFLFVYNKLNMSYNLYVIITSVNSSSIYIRRVLNAMLILINQFML